MLRYLTPNFGLLKDSIWSSRWAKFFILYLCVSASATAQSVFLYEYKWLAPTGDSVEAVALLTVFSGGDATARVRYALSGNDYVVEIKLVDSVSPQMARLPNERSLLPSEITAVQGTADRNFVPTAFTFVRTVVRNKVSFEPEAVFCATPNGMWQRTTVISKKWCAFNTLTPELVGIFYGPEEDYYKNIFSLGTRSLPSAERRSRLFLIAVANTVDKDVRESCRTDLFNCQELYSNLATGLGIRLVQQSVFGRGFSMAGVERAIAGVAAQKPNGNDILVFYYSGHGFRLPTDNTKFPYMSLRTRDDQPRMANAINVEALYNRLMGLGARMTLVISDCCNEKFEAVANTGPELLVTRSAGIPLNIENCRALFFPPQRRGVLVTSADVNQLASGNPSIGGYFSHHFKNTLEGYTSNLKSAVNWLQLLSEVRRSTAQEALAARCFNPKVPCMQHPWFAIR
ncbi:MAG: hypothetical protein EAY75_07300 [Bacteroidetes bacterium]|nr:MAG: hypothetical protein EAY75_07300 [Bacteroidota bacterium]